ncbi:amino acid permease [archaeon]|jgi:tyrosine-specific transport protein|nr:amino acid permease [archaeon]MBT6762233.1 amino acid permease [archaeon]
MANNCVSWCKENSKMLKATAVLTGTVIGAGILGIPYVVAKTGMLYGSAIIIIIGIVFLFLNLFLAEISLRTKGDHQLSGYMEKYLGRYGKIAMTFSMMVGIYGALTAYLIGEGESIKALIMQIPGLSSLLPGIFLEPITLSIIFFVICTIIVSMGVEEMGKAELVVVGFMLLVLLLISAFSIPKIQSSFLTYSNAKEILFPLGVIIFAFIGSAGIPEMKEILKKDKKKFKTAVIIGTITPIALYLFFCLAVIGTVGIANFENLAANERIATIALGYYIGPIMGAFANILAILAMFTSFITLGVALVEMYNYDYHIPRSWSIILTVSVPLFALLFNLTTFISALAITGIFAGGIDGILIVLAYWKAKLLGKRKPEFTMGKHKFVGYTIISLFLFGMIHQLYYLFF